MTTLPIYRGSQRRQVGGSIFGNGFKEAIPKFFKETVKPALSKLGRRIGQRVVHAGVRLASDALHDKIHTKTDLKNAVKKQAREEASILKRSLLSDMDEEYQRGGAKRRKVQTAPRKKVITYKRPQRKLKKKSIPPKRKAITKRKAVTKRKANIKRKAKKPINKNKSNKW